MTISHFAPLIWGRIDQLVLELQVNKNRLSDFCLENLHSQQDDETGRQTGCLYGAYITIRKSEASIRVHQPACRTQMTRIKNITRKHLSALRIDRCLMALIACILETYTLLLRQSPPTPHTLMLHTSSDTPNAMQGYDAPSPGSERSSCRMLLLFVCLSGRLAGWLTERVRGCFCAISKPPAPLVYPQHTASSSTQHQHPSLPTRPRPASWLCGILATANGVLMESPCGAPCWLDNRILTNEDDGNDLTLTLLPLWCCLKTEYFWTPGPLNRLLITWIVNKATTHSYYSHFVNNDGPRLDYSLSLDMKSWKERIEGAFGCRLFLQIILSFKRPVLHHNKESPR